MCKKHFALCVVALVDCSNTTRVIQIECKFAKYKGNSAFNAGVEGWIFFECSFESCLRRKTVEAFNRPQLR